MSFCYTPVVPFCFVPQAPLACPGPCAYQFFDEDPCEPWPAYQPVRPVYVWDGCRYVYLGPTPMFPPVWWQPPTAEAYCPL